MKKSVREGERKRDNVWKRQNRQNNIKLYIVLQIVCGSLSRVLKMPYLWRQGLSVYEAAKGSVSLKEPWRVVRQSHTLEVPHFPCFPFAQSLSSFPGHQAVSRTCPPLSFPSDFIIREELKAWQSQGLLSSQCCPAGKGSVVLRMLLSQEKSWEMHLCFLLEHD